MGMTDTLTPGRVEIAVEGMRCEGCVRAVTAALEGVPGVRRAEVDLRTGRARVEGNSLDAQRLIAALKELGYAAHTA
jgi:copper chaperone CopZ